MKKILSVFLTLALVLGLALPVKSEEFGHNAAYIRITVRDYGDIYAELYPDIAPITVENFLKLVNQGFYDGLTFHCIISGFMIQGGDPNGNGTGGSPDKIKGEFSQNGVNNPLLHDRGVLSMARSQDMNSASSQFFIMHSDSPHLDGSYAAFGSVLAGMWVVDKICQETPVQDRNGTVIRDDQPVIESIHVCEKEEASAAKAAEAEIGKGGTKFEDRLSPLSFTVPEGWHRTADIKGQVSFEKEQSDLRFVIVRSNQWAPLPAAYKASYAGSGMTQDKMDTSAFTKQSLVGMVGGKADDYAEETHSGIIFYTAEQQTSLGLYTYFIGAKNGYVYLFAFTGGRDKGAFAEIGNIMDALTLDSI